MTEPKDQPEAIAQKLRAQQTDLTVLLVSMRAEYESIAYAAETGDEEAAAKSRDLRLAMDKTIHDLERVGAALVEADKRARAHASAAGVERRRAAFEKAKATMREREVLAKQIDGAVARLAELYRRFDAEGQRAFALAVHHVDENRRMVIAPQHAGPLLVARIIGAMGLQQVVPVPGEALGEVYNVPSMETLASQDTRTLAQVCDDQEER